jgi:hypothetical protein
MDMSSDTRRDRMAAVVWVDHSHALIARAHSGRPAITEIERAYGVEPETGYLLRVLHEAGDCDRVVVMGPDSDRVAFEREYVALYRRPDRLIDVGAAAAPAPTELLDQLRMLEPSPAAVH